MKAKCLIKQPAGLGDIFSLQKVVWYYLSAGYDVVYPVLPQLLYIKDHIQHPGLTFVSVDEDFPHKQIYLSSQNIPIAIGNDHYLPLEHASQTQPGCVIRAKYNLIGLDWEDWSDYFVFYRNKQKEDELYYNILGLTDNMEYSVINSMFGTRPGNYTKQEVTSSSNLPNIVVDYIEGYNVFDWCKVFERASNIYTVDTSILFILEKLELRANDLHMWARFGDYTSIDGLFKLNWKYN